VPFVPGAVIDQARKHGKRSPEEMQKVVYGRKTPP
jgi:hypothetical protein